MAVNLDTRVYTYSRNFNAERVEQALQSTLPKTHRIKIRGVNPFLGSAQQVYSRYEDHNYSVPIESSLTDKEMIDRAQAHIKLLALALGFSSTETPEFVPDTHMKITDTGERVITFQQYYRGIPVFQMERTLWMEPDGTIHNIIGKSVGLPNDLEVVPNISAEQALFSAVTFLTLLSRRDKLKGVKPKFRINLKNYRPRVLARTALPSRPCVLGQKRLGEAVPAHLVLFYQGETTRLGWHMLISAPKLVEQYAVVVEARIEADEKRELEILYCQTTSKSLAPISGKVWLNNPNVNNERQLINFPRPKTDYPVDLPTGFPLPWLDGNVTKAGGNNTIVLQGINVEILEALPAAVDLNLSPPDEQAEAIEQRILNAFYFCNFLHDFFYTLGFNERRKNFQAVNPNGEGKGGDPVIVRVAEEILTDTAHLITLADGSQTLLDVGLHISSEKHGAIDADVMFHEYTHGVTNRLVGSQDNPQPLQRPQSEGMSEGWSDYFALTIQNYYLAPSPPAIERTVIGDWLTNGATGGLRGCSYDDSFANDGAGVFGAIGRPGAFGMVLARSHLIGRIWCAALMKMNRDLGKVLNDRKKGHLLGWQIVIAGLQFTPSNPNYLEGRDCIIQALKCRRRKGMLEDEDFQKAYTAVWIAFTRFGMGPKATSPNSELDGLTQDRDESEENIPKPNLDPFDPI